MNLTDYDAFIFDLDGTLIDSGKYHAQAFADVVLEQSGYTLSSDERLEVFASHSLSFCPILNQRHNLTLDPDAILVAKRARVREIFKADLFSGARDFLDKWHGLRPFGLATNSPLGFVRRALDEAGISPYFQSVTTADEVKQRKPNPEVFEIAFRKLGVVPGEVLVFEDQLIGIEAAQVAGAQVIAVDNGQSVEFPTDIPILKWKELLKL